jgi:hypothetical protein
MRTKFEAFVEAMHRGLEPVPEDLTKAIRELPPVEMQPSPWASWLYVDIVRLRRRQRWMAQQIKDRVPAEAFRTLFRQRQTHTFEIPEEGTWELAISRRVGQMMVRNQDTKERLDLVYSRLNGSLWSPNQLDVEGLRRYVSREHATISDQRLVALHPHEALYDPLLCTAWTLCEAGILATADPRDLRAEITINESAFLSSDVVQACSEFPEQPEARLWRTALMGDWLLAAELAAERGDAALTKEVQVRVKKCRQQRYQEIVDQHPGQMPNPSQALALHELDPWNLLEYVWHMRPEDIPWGDWAENGLFQQLDSHWRLLILDAFQQMAPEGLCGPEAEYMAGWLVDHDCHSDDVVDTMLQADWSRSPEGLTWFLLEHAPRKAIPFLLADLRCRGNQGLIGTLGLVDSPWTRRELRQVVARPLDDEEIIPASFTLPFPQHVAAALVALMESQDPETRQWATQEWAQRFTQPPDREWLHDIVEEYWSEGDTTRLREILAPEPSEEELQVAG